MPNRPANSPTHTCLENGCASAALLQSFPDAVITADQHGRVVFMNDAAESLTGASGRGSIGRLVEDVVHLVGFAHVAEERFLMRGLVYEQRAVAFREAYLDSPPAVRQRVAWRGDLLSVGGTRRGTVLVVRQLGERDAAPISPAVSDVLRAVDAQTAAIALEINNTLTVIRMGTQIARTALVGSGNLAANAGADHRNEGAVNDAVAALAEMESSVARLARTISNLRPVSAGPLDGEALPIERGSSEPDVLFGLPDGPLEAQAAAR